eukprot:g43342.t1
MTVSLSQFRWWRSRRIFLELVAVFSHLFLVMAEPLAWKSSKHAWQLPNGVRAYEAPIKTGSCGRPMVAWLVTADLFLYGKTWDLGALPAPDSKKNLSTVSDFAKAYGSVFASNAGPFSVTHGVGRPESLAAARGTITSHNVRVATRAGLSYYPTRCVVGADASGKWSAAWTYTDYKTGVLKAYTAPTPNKPTGRPEPPPTEKIPTQAQPWDLKTGVGGAPMLVYQGQDVSDSSFQAEVMWGSGVSTVFAARTVIGLGRPTSLGLRGPQLLWMVTDGCGTGGLSLRALAQEMLYLGATEACNLEGISHPSHQEMLVSGHLHTIWSGYR